MAELILAAECCEPFVTWLTSIANIRDFITYDRLAPSVSDVRAELFGPALADYVKFESIGEKACAAKLWILCRDAMATETSPTQAATASDAHFSG